MLQSAVAFKDPNDVSGHNLLGNLTPAQMFQTGGSLDGQFYYRSPVLSYLRGPV